MKNVTKPDPNPISIVFGSFLDHLGWDKMILVKTIFRHISDPKIEAVWDEKWSDDKKHSTIRRRLAPSTLLQFFSTVGTFWVPPEQLWHPKLISSFFTRFRSQTGSTRSTRALYRSQKRRSGSEIDEKISCRESRDNFLPNKLLSIPNGPLVVENECFPYWRKKFRRSPGVGPAL